MTFQFQSKFSAAYQREIENKPVNDVMFSGIFAAVLIFVTFVWGIQPASKTLTQNLKYKQELIAVKTAMEAKVAKTDDGVATIKVNQEKVDLLNTVMPSRVDLDKFLSELVISTSKAGFVVNRIKQGDEEKGEVPINIEMSGTLLQLPEMVKAVEEMSRFVKIEEIRTEQDHDVAILRMKVMTYIL